MVGTIFRKLVERHELGEAGKSVYQTWKVMTDLGDGIYNCVRVDSTHDPMATANPQKRTFKQEDILKHLKQNSNATPDSGTGS
jgi:hypothetical protein